MEAVIIPFPRRPTAATRPTPVDVLVASLVCVAHHHLGAAAAGSTACAGQLIEALERFDQSLASCQRKLVNAQQLFGEMQAATELAARDPEAAAPLLVQLRRRFADLQAGQ